MKASEVGVSHDPANSQHLRSAGAADRPGGKSARESAEPTHARLNFRVVPSIPTPEPPVPPLAAQFLSPWFSAISHQLEIQCGRETGRQS